jgi:hypothetical protein
MPTAWRLRSPSTRPVATNTIRLPTQRAFDQIDAGTHGFDPRGGRHDYDRVRRAATAQRPMIEDQLVDVDRHVGLDLERQHLFQSLLRGGGNRDAMNESLVAVDRHGQAVGVIEQGRQLLQRGFERGGRVERDLLQLPERQALVAHAQARRANVGFTDIDAYET